MFDILLNICILRFYWNSYTVFSAWSCTRLLWQSGSRTQTYLQVYQNTVSCGSANCRVCNYYTCKSCLHIRLKYWFYILTTSRDWFLFWERTWPICLQYRMYTSSITYMFSRVERGTIKVVCFLRNTTQKPWQHRDPDHSPFGTSPPPPYWCVVAPSVAHCQMFDCIYFH